MNTKAETLRRLHVPGKPLVLPNAWDAASAGLVEKAGFPAVATSSNATAAVLGYADGEATPVDEVLAYVARIVRNVNVPVTVDFERGYRLAPAELVERLAASGAVGLNLEDSDPKSGKMIDPAEQSDFLAAVRVAAAAAGVDLVINARVDSFVRGEQISDTIERGRRYLAAGADCVYPIGAPPDAIGELVAQIPGPINIGYAAGTLTLAQLAERGVARVSFGPSLQRHLYGLFEAQVLAAIAVGDDPFAK